MVLWYYLTLNLIRVHEAIISVVFTTRIIPFDSPNNENHSLDFIICDLTVLRQRINGLADVEKVYGFVVVVVWHMITFHSFIPKFVKNFICVHFLFISF